MDYKHIVVLVTVDSEKTARKVTSALLKARKAACVNIISKVESHYWWQGKIETADELLLVVKTRAELLDDVIALAKKNHPYTLPEMIALPIIGGNEDYLRWVEGETK